MRALAPTPRKEKQRKYDELKAPLFNELKTTIAVETVLQFSTVDLTVARQNSAASKYYHGKGSLVSQIGQFITGSGNFGNIWATEDTEYGVLFVIPEFLHRQPSKIFSSGKNVTSEMLSRSFLKQSSCMSGSTIRSNAVLCTRLAKKMLTLVDEAIKGLILEKNGTAYGYPSGKNETDFIDFVLYRMYHWNTFNGASGDIYAPVDELRDS